MLPFALLVIAIVILILGHAILAAVAVTVLYGAWYAWSITRHPKRVCWRCKGQKEHRDTTIDKGVSGRCLICGDRGRLTRWGVIVFRPKVHAEIKAGIRGRYH